MLTNKNSSIINGLRIIFNSLLFNPYNIRLVSQQRLPYYWRNRFLVSQLSCTDVIFHKLFVSLAKMFKPRLTRTCLAVSYNLSFLVVCDICADSVSYASAFSNEDTHYLVDILTPFSQTDFLRYHRNTYVSLPLPHLDYAIRTSLFKVDIFRRVVVLSSLTNISNVLIPVFRVRMLSE